MTIVGVTPRRRPVDRAWRRMVAQRAALDTRPALMGAAAIRRWWWRERTEYGEGGSSLAGAYVRARREGRP